MFDRLWWRSRRTVMIVAEQRPDPALVAPFLNGAGLRLVHARPDHGAMRLARRRRPSLIIEEVQAPDDAGLAFRRQLRASPDTREIPLIVVTAAELRARTDEAHAQAVLVKPIDGGDMFREVRRFLPLPRRRSTRYGVNLRFEFGGDREGWRQAFSRDLSIRGTFLKTDLQPALGSRFDLRFHLPGSSAAIVCRAAVVHVRSGNDPASGHSTGFAIEFEELEEIDAQRLEHYIRLHADTSD